MLRARPSLLVAFAAVSFALSGQLTAVVRNVTALRQPCCVLPSRIREHMHAKRVLHLGWPRHVCGCRYRCQQRDCCSPACRHFVIRGHLPGIHPCWISYISATFAKRQRHVHLRSRLTMVWLAWLDVAWHAFGTADESLQMRQQQGFVHPPSAVTHSQELAIQCGFCHGALLEGRRLVGKPFSHPTAHVLQAASCSAAAAALPLVHCSFQRATESIGVSTSSRQRFGTRQCAEGSTQQHPPSTGEP